MKHADGIGRFGRTRGWVILAALLAWPTLLPAATGTPSKPQPEAPVYSFKDVDTMPALSGGIDFPTLRHYYGAKPEVNLAVVVGGDGKVVQVETLSTNEKDFGSDALKEVKRWKFTPASKGAEKVTCTIVICLRAEIDERAAHVGVRREILFLTPKGWAKLPLGADPKRGR